MYLYITQCNVLSSLQILGGLLCDPCKSLVAEGESMGTAFGKGWLEGQIDDLCKSLGFFKEECDKILDTVVDQLVVLIKQGLPPLVCCQTIDCCDK